MKKVAILNQLKSDTKVDILGTLLFIKLLDINEVPERDRPTLETIAEQKAISVIELSNLIKARTGNVSKQLMELREAGLVKKEKSGRQRLYSLTEDIETEVMNLIGAVINIQHKHILEQYNIPPYKFKKA